ncbi:MAG: hypothetical protein WCW78_00860 [Candidatus Paceibacterota bacterium]|jgi:hypothetical protein
MEQKSLVALVGVGVVALVVGYLVGVSQGGKAVTASYASKIEAVSKLFPSMPDIRIISGTVKSVSGKVITIETQTYGNPFEDVPKVREITVGTNTKVTKNEAIPGEEYQKLNNAYQVAVQKFQKEQQAAMTSGKPALLPSGGYPMMPSPTKQVDISVSDIKVGDIVAVSADKNIKTEASFEASSISVSASTPTLPPAKP